MHIIQADQFQIIKRECLLQHQDQDITLPMKNQNKKLIIKKNHRSKQLVFQDAEDKQQDPKDNSKTLLILYYNKKTV